MALIYINDETHRKFKAFCALNGVSMSKELDFLIKYAEKKPIQSKKLKENIEIIDKNAELHDKIEKEIKNNIEILKKRIKIGIVPEEFMEFDDDKPFHIQYGSQLPFQSLIQEYYDLNRELWDLYEEMRKNK